MVFELLKINLSPKWEMRNVISISYYTDNESIKIVCMFDNKYRSAIPFASKGLVGRRCYETGAKKRRRQQRWRRRWVRKDKTRESGSLGEIFHADVVAYLRERKSRGSACCDIYGVPVSISDRLPSPAMGKRRSWSYVERTEINWLSQRRFQNVITFSLLSSCSISSARQRNLVIRTDHFVYFPQRKAERDFLCFFFKNNYF